MAESKAAAHSPALDGVRALAASMVVLHHIGTLAGTSEVWATGAYFRRMDSGVSIFFVLSGFLLYRPMLARQLAGAPVVSFGSFWRSRFWRIFPAYWLALAVLWAIEAVKIVDAENTFHLVTLTQIYNPYWILTGIVPAWSLATEISFYALLPFLALGIARLGRGTTIGRQAGLAVVVALLLYAASFAWRIVLETCFRCSPSGRRPGCPGRSTSSRSACCSPRSRPGANTTPPSHVSRAVAGASRAPGCWAGSSSSGSSACSSA